MKKIDFEYERSQLVQLKECFADPLLEVMNILNEIVLDHPEAISFAPGRPLETHFQVEESLAALHHFVTVAAGESGLDEKRVWRDLGQYNRTNGTINELISKQLALDEDIQVPPEAIIVTVGAQEAMAIVLAGLFEPARDILLASDPTYIGITGLAKILGIRVLPVSAGDNGVEPEAVEQAISSCRSVGTPRALYDIPDFNNPLGTSLSLDRRLRLLEICHKNDILLIEDNPYGMFNYSGEKLPTLKALDKHATVIYIGSFSKTIFPGLRLGYLVADQHVEHGKHLLAKELSKVKSLITVNTSPLLQAIVGGILLKNNGSLQPVVRSKVGILKRNRDVMLECLAKHFRGSSERVQWNHPNGGFFLTMKLPFPFGQDELKRCACDYGVIVCPMRFFTLGQDRECQIRLSFSYVDEEQIDEGVNRLAHFINDRSSVRGMRPASSCHAQSSVPESAGRKEK